MQVVDDDVDGNGRNVDGDETDGIDVSPCSDDDW